MRSILAPVGWGKIANCAPNMSGGTGWGYVLGAQLDIPGRHRGAAPVGSWQRSALVFEHLRQPLQLRSGVVELALGLDGSQQVLLERRRALFQGIPGAINRPKTALPQSGLDPVTLAEHLSDDSRHSPSGLD